MTKKSALSKRAKALLLAREGLGLDYKLDVEAITAEDLCAFANMENGGVILSGIIEEKHQDGTTVGRPVGCSVADSSQLTLVNKAQQCHPPIAVSLHVERANDVSFLRIEIPPSATRPHCTPSGRYVARDVTP